MNEMLEYRITVLFEEVDDSTTPKVIKELDFLQEVIDTGPIEPSLRKEYAAGIFEKIYGELELLADDSESIQEFRGG